MPPAPRGRRRPRSARGCRWGWTRKGWRRRSRWPCRRPAGSSEPSARRRSRCRSASRRRPGCWPPTSSPRAPRPTRARSTSGSKWSEETPGGSASPARPRQADAAQAGAAASAAGGGRLRGRPHTGGGAPAADPPAPHHWPPGQVQHGVRARGDAARRLPRLRQLHRRGGQPAGRQGAGGAGRGGHLPGRPGPAGGRRARRAAAHRREHPRRAPGGTFGGAVAAARPRRPRRQAGRLRRRRARAAGRADLAGGRAGAPGAAARRSPGPPARALRLRGGVVAVRPLDGITVVSLEQAVAAPFATRQLADLGARVIKVERPGAGDFARTYDESVRGLSSYFVWLNRSKESLTLDVKAPRGRAVLEALLERADVFVQNLGPGAARRLGLGADELEGRFPRLVVCDLSGYGSDGPWADRRAYDLL